MKTQYVSVKFNPWDRRTYTYANDIEPVEPGDKVKVNTPQRDGQIVTVESVTDRKPPFHCKPIIEVIKPEPELI